MISGGWEGNPRILHVQEVYLLGYNTKADYVQDQGVNLKVQHEMAEARRRPVMSRDPFKLER